MPAVEGGRVEVKPWIVYLAGVMGVLGVVVSVAVGVYLIRKYRERKWGKCTSKRRLDGKVVVVTGANSGIGKEVARDLASRGALVVLACRNKEAALQAVKEIRTTTGDGELIVMELDLGELSSVRSFSTSLLGKFSHLDILINNAGLYVPPGEEGRTKDGYEIHFGVNHLGHFLLTHLLLPRLQETPGARVVTVASSLYKSGKIDLEDLESKNGYDKKMRNALYANSKLANVLHSQEIARRSAGTGLRAFALCPGLVHTGLFRYSANSIGLLRKLLFAPVMYFFMRSAWQGAQSVIYCAVSEELDDKEWTMVADCKPTAVTSVAEDPETARRLWEVSLAMVETGMAGEAVAGSSEGQGGEVTVEDLLGFETVTKSMIEAPEGAESDVAETQGEAEVVTERLVDVASSITSTDAGEVKKGVEKLGNAVEKATEELTGEVQKVLEPVEPQRKVEKVTESLVGAARSVEKAAESIVPAAVSAEPATLKSAKPSTEPTPKNVEKTTEPSRKIETAPEPVRKVEAAPEPPKTIPEPPKTVSEPAKKIEAVPEPPRTIPEPPKTVPEPAKTVPEPAKKVEAAPEPPKTVPEPAKTVPEPAKKVETAQEPPKAIPGPAKKVEAAPEPPKTVPEPAKAVPEPHRTIPEPFRKIDAAPEPSKPASEPPRHPEKTPESPRKFVPAVEPTKPVREPSRKFEEVPGTTVRFEKGLESAKDTVKASEPVRKFDQGVSKAVEPQGGIERKTHTRNTATGGVEGPAVANRGVEEEEEEEDEGIEISNNSEMKFNNSLQIEESEEEEEEEMDEEEDNEEEEDDEEEEEEEDSEEEEVAIDDKKGLIKQTPKRPLK
ncbi:neurofilament heavy polypeptide-like isoform X2 [Scylla paramamosain]|uniref:neurofilament heavy polypeptide-like isoform X2 n=1 Tax=Scylla paramamosain TaxID=85552 RepID=UPI0030830154